MAAHSAQIAPKTFALTLRTSPSPGTGTNHLADRIWALRDNVSAYDAAFVALAEALDVPLITCDARLANAPGMTAELFAHQ